MQKGTKSLTKPEVVDILIKEGLADTKKDATELLKTVSLIDKVVIESLKEGQKANVGDYHTVGKVHQNATEERQGINPKTKEEITIEAKPAKTKVVVTATNLAKKLV